MIKKLLIVIFTLFLTLNLFAQQTVKIDTPYSQTISISIPDEPDAKDELIIKLATLYWGERYDFEQIYSLLNNGEDLSKVNTTLIDTQNTLIDTQNTLITAQEEIKTLRKEIEDTTIPASSILQLGIGYTFPNGGEMLLNIDIPNFPIGIYGRANIQFDNTFNLGIGIVIDL